MSPNPLSPSTQSKLTDAVSHAATALVVLAVGGILSVAAAYWMSNQVEREARLRFENAVTDAHNAVESHIRAYSDVLLGVRGLFIASNSVTRDEFRGYIESLELTRRYPGIQGINYGQRITATQKQAFETKVRNDTSVDPRGYPDFAVKPSGNRPEYVVVKYVEPIAGNEVALGLDLAGDAVRLAALERTRDSGRITASGRIALSLDPRRDPGFAMRLPVYRKGMPLATVAQRREAFTGMVSAAFVVIDLMRGVLGEQFLQQTQVRIHDAGFLDSPNGLRSPTAENLMFDSDRLLATPASPSASNDGKAAGPTSMSVLDVGGRRWNLYFTARQAFAAPSDRWLPAATLLGGITISVLLFGLMRSLATVGRYATTLAASITEDLRQSEARLTRSQRMTQELIEVLPNPVYFKGIDGRYLGVNKAWEAYHGMPRQAFLGKTVHELYPNHPEVAARLHADDQWLWEHPGTRVYETSITTADGKQHDAVYYKATFTHADGSIAGLIGTVVDITERKQVAEVNARLATIVETSNDAIVSRSLDLKVLSWNAAAERLFGYSAAEAIGQNIYALIIPPDREAEAERTRAQLEQGRAVLDLETVRRTKDGRLIDASLSQSPINDERGAMVGVSLIFRDIAERKHAEQAARRQNELTQLLEALARAANEAQTPEEVLQALLKLICTHGRWPVGHVVTFAPDSHVQVPNFSLWQLENRARFADIIEHSASFDYAGREGTFLDIVINQQKPAWMEDLCTVPVGPRGAALISKGMHAAFGFPVVVGDEVLALLEFFAAEPRPADTLLLANLTNVGAQLARVIERERALNALREREHLMRLVTEGVPAMIAYFDAELRCRFANTAYCEFRHLDPQGVIGKTLREITGEDTHRVISPSIDLVKQGKPVTQRRQERTATGEIRHIEIHRVPDMSPEGEFRGYYVMVLDITEPVRAEEVRDQLEAQLRQAQKLEAIGTLAGGIAHDFNNILGAIIGNAELARKDVGAGHRALVSIEEIYRASQRAKELVQQILTFGRKQPQQTRLIALRPVVEDAVKLLRATLPASVEIATAVSDIPLYVHADATQIQQVLMNLCTNAWHAMEGRAGRIEIGLDEVLLDAAAVSTLSDLQPGRHARLGISDNGCGMDAATQARIFEPFFTTKVVGQGTGLGLSVVHGIIKAHHGAITLKSAPGEGATFRIYFPAAAAPQAEALPEPAAAPGPARGNGQHVLYVDDDGAMVFLVTRMLEELGYRISGYERAEEALKAVRADAGDFDLVVTDFNMPGLSGLQVAQELARIRPGLPVVITSGYITEELRASALQAGVRHLLYKPDTIDELCQIIQRLLATASARATGLQNESTPHP